jgi:hypothetical protein
LQSLAPLAVDDDVVVKAPTLAVSLLLPVPFA